jgi:hypothetical protein
MSRLISYPANFQPNPPVVEVPEDESIFTTTVEELGITDKVEVIPSEQAMEIISRPTVSQGKTHLTATAPWTWEQMRDYVIGEIQARWGARPRDPLKESGIFKGFINRWGDKSEPIARAAFEVYNGVWNGAPIAVERFSKGSDPYFAEVLSKNV